MGVCFGSTETRKKLTDADTAASELGIKQSTPKLNSKEEL
jgi:hypothetical protein